MGIDWNAYNSAPFYDELISTPGNARKHARAIVSYLHKLKSEEIGARKHAAEVAITTMGITFTVYSDAGNIDRDWPFDIIPRVIAAKEWAVAEQGLTQRLQALNRGAFGAARRARRSRPRPSGRYQAPRRHR